MRPLTSSRDDSAEAPGIQRLTAPSRGVARQSAVIGLSASLMLALALIGGCRSGPTKALERAIVSGSPREVAALLRAGADPNADSLSGEPLLWLAVRMRRDDSAVALLQAGANPKTEYYRMNILFAVVSMRPSCPVEVLRALVRAGSDVNTVNMYTGDTPLMDALEHDAQPCVDLLLSSGAKTNVRNLAGGTALHSAAKGSSSVMVAKMLDLGLGIDSVMTEGTTPLMLAAQRRPEGGENELVIATLLDHGANPCRKNLSGQSAAAIALKFNLVVRAERLAAACAAWRARRTSG